ncbi:carbon-nitrogen hydrolase family protein [Shewanella sp. NIFS-20-20]|uniref:carbon-nitrogen hydrolase family protein n=1 Tax=Shewanella sp. NIFS-20-20 TaxID=2853806 RepID=UPI001C444C05|nr:carbon-nitrogen hydrolase family protein [Shewanella sp. NIFS-20-20]MBV7315310.1 carbon-nitrogen hydrolase family protein [Shewanella sp. NIFS-20-20]
MVDLKPQATQRVTANISLLQCQSGRDPEQNLAFIYQQLQCLDPAISPRLVVLPECALLFGGRELEQQQLAANSQYLRILAGWAAEFAITLVAGTVPVNSDDGRCYSRCHVWGPDGRLLGDYDKLHLFDASISDNTGRYCESTTFCPGDRISVIDTEFGKLGLAICYDLRFPELFRALAQQGCDIILVPAAFTAVTGRAHWQTLLQARALDSQCVIAAAAQWHPEGKRQTWGHSMVVGPWGDIVAQKPRATGWLHVEVNLNELARVRDALPLSAHNRFQLPSLKVTSNQD